MKNEGWSVTDDALEHTSKSQYQAIILTLRKIKALLQNS